MKHRILSLVLMLAMLVSFAACGAQPSAPSVYEVRFELNGGELVSGKLLQHVEAGSGAQAPEVMREGYVFDSWSESFDAVSEDMVVVAQWARAEEPASVYEVRFELNGGELVSGKLLQHVEAGSGAQAPEVMREGYSFDGWSESFDAVSEDLIVTAMWTRDPEPEAAPATYEVRFEMNGGELVSGKLLQHVEAGSAAQAPELVREGYVLDGWSERFDNVTENIITAAKWSKLYAVHFNPAGGEIVTGEGEQMVREGDYPAPPEVVRRNYAFSGWSPELSAVSGEASYTATWSPVELSSEQVFSKISPAVVEISAYEPSGYYYNLGSGFFIDDQGTFVTNYHVIDETISGEIALLDGSTVEIVAVLGYDPNLDIAILKADITGNPYLTLAENGVSTGETIFALGSSEGLTSTFSTGIVSAASRIIDGVTYIQITAPISHGNSGGPLVNVFGEVVGINTMGYIEGQNLNFAVDIREIENVDRSNSLTLQEVYEIQYPVNASMSTSSIGGGAGGSSGGAGGSSGGSTGGSTGSSDDGFYDVAERAEQESNDTFLHANQLGNGPRTAGEVSHTGDQDWFYFELSGATDVTLTVVPAYVEDMDYLHCTVMRLDNTGGTKALGELSYTDNGNYLSMSGTVHFDEAGYYFLLISMDSSYPYNEPLYYIIETDW